MRHQAQCEGSSRDVNLSSRSLRRGVGAAIARGDTVIRSAVNPILPDYFAPSEHDGRQEEDVEVEIQLEQGESGKYLPSLEPGHGWEREHEICADLEDQGRDGPGQSAISPTMIKRFRSHAQAKTRMLLASIPFPPKTTVSAA